MKLASTAFAVLLGLLGVAFIAGSEGQLSLLAFGAALLVGGGLLLRQQRAARTRHSTPRGEVPGSALPRSGAATGAGAARVALQSAAPGDPLVCLSCSGALGEDSMSVEAGTIVVACPQCGTRYPLDRAPPR